jgi:DNA polymerase I-like protein with 3'-5' exonuclease and polymerase domains
MLTLFDLESDGLYDDVSKVYCLSYTHDGVNIDTTTSVSDMATILCDSKYIVGHNISIYDLLVLKKLYGIEPKGLVIDTLALSWYLDPNRIKHGLEDYGLEFGYPKVVVEDHEWQEGDMGLMIQRCERDVRINWKVWEKQSKVLKELYG